ncbi:MAG: hypothetical protein ACKERG_01280 [Candidatus Hodgkinia cicadicola]
MKLKPVFNRITVEACAPQASTLKVIIIPDVISSEASLGLMAAGGEGVELRVEGRVLYVRCATVSCSEVQVSVDVLRLDGVLAVVCDE